VNSLVRFIALGAVCLAAACGDNNNKPDEVSVVLFAAAPDAIEAGQSTKLLYVVEPKTATVTITGLGDVSGKTQSMVTPTATTMYKLTAVNGKATATADVTVTVGPQNALGFKVEPASATPTAGDQLAVTVTAISGDGTTAPGYRGTAHLASTDTAAVLPADFQFAAADAGVKQVMVTLKTAGAATLTANDTVKVGSQGSATVTVQAAAASVYQLTTLPATATAGQPLALTITARDAFGNVATSYAGQVNLTSTDATDVLPAAGGFTSGVRTVSLAFVKAGSHIATVQDAAATIASVDTSSVQIDAATPFRITTTVANPSTTAGTAEAFSAQLVDVYGNVCTNYTGTMHFVSNDAAAAVPTDYTFTAGDAGKHDFSVTLKTAGTESVFLSDTANAAFTGSATWTVGAGAAATCVAAQAPASAVAGSLVGMTIVVRDAFGNLATTYGGTMTMTATDPRATLPVAVTYVPADAGAKAVSVALFTAGSQTVTATDVANAALTCAAPITVNPAAAKIVLGMPPNANAGYVVNVAVAVKDIYDNALPGYTGTVTFTSSDTGAGHSTPAPLVFSGSEGGVGSTVVLFVTMGPQTLSATDAGTPVATGTASSTVHGLVYTAPSNGRVRLVANAAQSNAQVIQLDLVANERLEQSDNFDVGPGSFAAGMNLPLDTTRTDGAAATFIEGNALPGGQTAVAAKLGADHVFYAGVAIKRVAGDLLSQGVEVEAGQVFFSLRLKLAAAGLPGTVFDGAQPQPLFRASVRDQFGDDFVSQADVGLGKLEIK
jgi:hypothetical protein